MEEKVFKSMDDMIDLLISRGIDIPNTTERDYAKNVLNKIGYYNLINGYNKLFLSENSIDVQYKPGTTLHEINALYQFDRVIRNIFFKHILEVETNVKSLIAYYFSEAHGHKNYLIYTNFNTSLRKSEEMITKLIADIQYQISSRSADPSISHYLKVHGYIPLWVLNNILTLGSISKFYSLMLVPERQNVSRHFNLLDNELENVLFYISKIRNFCAHGNRLYCFKSKTALMNKKYHNELNIATSPSGEYIHGKRDLFAGMIALKCVLSNNDYKRLSKELYRAIGILDRKLVVLTKEQVLAEMGFPENWRELNTY